MRLSFILVMALACLARAQEDIPAPPPIFTGTSLRLGLEESLKTKKFLIVYPHFDKPGWREMDETTWKNPTLATWVMWHAVAVRIDPQETPADYAALQSAIRAGRGKVPPIASFPHVLVFRDGKFARAYPDPDFQAFLYEDNVLFGDKADVKVFYPKAMQVLFMLDFLCDKTRALEPMWMMLHDEANPMPQEPARPAPLCQGDDGNAPKVDDPARGVDAVLSMVEKAREMVKAKELFDATGVYSWLWERGEEIDPSFRAARLSFIAAEIADLARQRDGSMARIVEIRERLAARQPWWTWNDLREWMILSRMLGRDGEVIEYLSQYTVDEQEQAMMPASHRSVYTALSNLDEVGNPRDASQAAFERVSARAHRLANTAKPMSSPAAEWAEVVTLRRRLVVDEGSRLYAALLLKGEPVRAGQVSKMVIGAADTPETRRGLVTMCRVAGVAPRPEHRQWMMGEAETAGTAPFGR